MSVCLELISGTLAKDVAVEVMVVDNGGAGCK